MAKTAVIVSCSAIGCTTILTIIRQHGIEPLIVPSYSKALEIIHDQPVDILIIMPNASTETIRAIDREPPPVDTLFMKATSQAPQPVNVYNPHISLLYMDEWGTCEAFVERMKRV